MTDKQKILAQFQKNKAESLTASYLSKFTHIPRTSVIKRISELRNDDGVRIRSEVRTVQGQKKTYYSLAA